MHCEKIVNSEQVSSLWNKLDSPSLQKCSLLVQIVYYVLIFFNILSFCCDLTCQAAKHHTVIHSFPPPSGMGESIRDKKRVKLVD